MCVCVCVLIYCASFIDNSTTPPHNFNTLYSRNGGGVRNYKVHVVVRTSVFCFVCTHVLFLLSLVVVVVVVVVVIEVVLNNFNSSGVD